MRRTLALAREHPGILPGLGVHPSAVVRMDEAQLAEALDFMAAHLASAAFVGEIGLDFRDASTPFQQDRQRAALREQLALASRMGRPVCLHSRRAQRECWEIATTCMETWGVPALLHWFTHSTKLVVAACQRPGVYVSAGPSVLFHPESLRVACAVSLDRLLVESDAPVRFGTVPSGPQWVPRVVEALAQAKGVPTDELAMHLDRNVHGFLLGGRAGA